MQRWPAPELSEKLVARTSSFGLPREKVQVNRSVRWVFICVRSRSRGVDVWSGSPPQPTFKARLLLFLGVRNLKPARTPARRKVRGVTYSERRVALIHRNLLGWAGEVTFAF